MSTPSSSRNSTHASPHASLNALLFRKLMPLLVISYVISFLDRTNIALAKHTMSIDLGLSSAAYGLGAGLFFLTYAAFEIPSNLVMHRVGARFWITRIMVTWGVLSVAMAFVRGETSFYVMRLLLGVAEAGLFPGVMLYLTYWFGREDRARATGYFLLGVCVANIVGGPLGGALLEMDGVLGFHGWQWLFMVEGAPAVLLAIVVWKMLPDRPTRASWLPREEALALERRLAAEQEAIGTGHGGHTFRAALADRQIWLSIFVYFCHQLTIYTVIFFLPGIIGSSGHFSPFVVGVLTSTPWVAAALGAALLPRFASNSSRSRRMLVGGLLIMAAGMLVAAYSTPVIGFLGVCVSASMFFVVQSIIFTFPSSRLSGSALAGGLGLVNTCGLLGGFVGPTVMGIIEQSTGKAMNGLVCLAVALIVAAICSVRLRHGHETRKTSDADRRATNAA
ncbi:MULTISPECIES: MFS transporter [unclassified Caballeronia]|uniref:MFS transporter n=1 Tax=unclassified Caballeronia TaxID=2646786 RepID=UPI0020284A31|nr:MULTISPECIES: MFS transporter [unclassified Caballeronia]MDR5774040.1 MFS transporter [Caballeronia sp. LZ002]MDR5800098.1 MFS transporter [Caballeronia sp. LZ001]MDR5849475.1 MFS transporter [Caballeronia sp. LZ003]